MNFPTMLRIVRSPPSIWICLASGMALTAAEPPVAVLQREGTSITVALPDAQAGYYRGPRFDWGGIVIQAAWRGRTVFTELKRPHNALLHDHGAGACEEFGFDGGEGYDDAPIGGRFLKIGVGALIRDDGGPYVFNHAYPIAQAGTWRIEPEDGSLRFTQEFALDAHFAYRYVKTISVHTDGFRIERRLSSLGDRPIHTTHYCHNMIAIDQRPIDGTWRLDLGWDVLAKHPVPTFTTTARSVSLSATLASTLWTDFSWGITPAATDLTLVHGASRTAIRIMTDKPPVSLSLYAEKTAICPEPFIAIRADAGSDFSWTTDYTFSEP